VTGGRFARACRSGDPTVFCRGAAPIPNYEESFDETDVVPGAL
jgi:hypothetical protein